MLILLWRGLRRRCPRCGGGRLFRGWFGMAERCPGCGLPLEREEGHGLGAMAINIGVTEALFGVLFVSGFVATGALALAGPLHLPCLA